MIARMVKVEIVGPNGMLLEVLSLLRELGVFQIEQDSTRFVAAKDQDKVRSHVPDEKTLAERIFYEELRGRIDELFACLPPLKPRQSYLDPESVLESIAETLQRHAAVCREWCRKRESLRKELEELNGYRVFLDALEPHLGNSGLKSGLDFIGVTIRETESLEELMRVMSGLTQGRFEIVTAKAADGTLVGLVTLEKGLAAKVRSVLGEQHVPELSFPAAMSDLPFPKKIGFLRSRIGEATAELAAVDAELARFAQRWGAIYAGVRSWLDVRLALLKNVAYLQQTGMCFLIQDRKSVV